MWEILIDEHRQIYGVVFVNASLTDAEKAAKRARLAHARAQLSGAGHTASIVSVNAFPTGFAIGRVLSANGSSASLPTESHEPRLILERRRDVERWALRTTDHGFLLRAQTEMYLSRSYRASADDLSGPVAPPLTEIWKALVLLTLAAAQRDEWLNDRNVWPGIEKNISITSANFFAHAATSHWPHSVYQDMESMVAFFTLPVRDGSVMASVGPSRMPSSVVSAANLRAGRSAAEAVLYGKR